MTRKDFEKRAARDAEKRLGIPAGWWGTYRDVQGPGSIRVYFSGNAWRITVGGKLVSKHDSRTFAISKARKLVRK